MRKYRLVAKKGEGTFSEVLKAQNVKKGTYHAIKCMKNHFDSIEQVNNLREIQALRRLSPHPNIVKLEEVLYDQPTGRLALVFELLDMNLYEMIRGRRHYLEPDTIRFFMFELLRSLDHMHRRGIFHRDIKPENILVVNAQDCRQGLKLADFGSCRGIYSKQPYTEYISTRWCVHPGGEPSCAPPSHVTALPRCACCCAPCHAVRKVSSAGVLTHRRLLRRGDGHLGCGVRVL